MADALDPAQILPDILAEHGPLSEDDLVRRFEAAGVPDAEDAFYDLIDEFVPAAARLLDDRWFWLPSLLEGRVFTHRLSANELAHDILTVVTDLDPITILCETPTFGRFADGSPARIAFPEINSELLDGRDIPLEVVDLDGALLLAPGTLAGIGVSAGELVGLRLTTQGFVVEPVSTIADVAVGARLAALLEDTPAFFDAVVWSACVDDPTLFTTPLAPLSQIVEDSDLLHEDGFLAPAGFDFNVWHFERGCALFADRYGLNPDDALALYMLLQLCDQMALMIETADDEEPVDDSSDSDGDLPIASEDSDQVELSGRLGGALADPLLAEILMTEALYRGRSGAAALGLLAETLEPRVPRTARVAFRWLRAVAAERLGSVEEAERELLAAEAMDTDWSPVLFDLARFAADRGDVERGLSLLRRAGAAPDDSMVTVLEQHRSTPRSDVGRNDACWCGSGRKYKKCHLGSEQLSLRQRASWLYAKAAQHVDYSDWRDLLAEVEAERHRYLDDEDAAAADPLPMDAVLFEGGAFGHFLHTRGYLLPEDERALGEQWVLTERSVFEVLEVDPGQSITLRDVRTGDTHAMPAPRASRLVAPGQLICAHLLPAGDDTVELVGGLEPVAPHQRDALLALLDGAPDPVELVAQLSLRFAADEPN